MPAKYATCKFEFESHSTLVTRTRKGKNPGKFKADNQHLLKGSQQIRMYRKFSKGIERSRHVPKKKVDW